MKIGILTYHRSHNYGALLQAIALRKVLEDMGHQALFIDYWPSYHRHMYALFSFSRMMSRKGIYGKYVYMLSAFSNFFYRRKRIINFNIFIKNYIKPYVSSTTDTYDVIIHGSDQIWRKQSELNTYNPVYFGKHKIKSNRKVSYAASMGVLSEKESDKQMLNNLLSNLNDISVRERDLFDLVYSFGYTEVRQDIDPTLLLTSEDWVNIFNLKKNEYGEKYALYYMIKDSFDVESLKRFAQSKGCHLKIIYSKAVGQDTNNQIMTAGPRQFLDLIYNAEFVFTSSFHGLAFSLLFHKPFLASFNNNAGRAASLLELIGLSNRLVLPKVDIPIQISEINYDRVDSKLYKMRISSINYLNATVF